MTEALPAALTRMAGFLDTWPGPAAVIGGVAFILRVRARPRTDVDLLISVGDRQLDDVLAHALAHGYVYDEGEVRELEAGRPIDIDDVLAIKDVALADLDRDHLHRWAHRLGLSDKLALYFPEL